MLSNTDGGDEGTAMLEIVHDMVPGAELYFHDLGGNTVAFNSAIDDLITAGCDIICDDIGLGLLEPFYEDGTVASHINSVINANDIIYVSSAGNSGGSHYQGDFFPIPAQPTQHDFSEGGTNGFLSLP
ncbi:MAG: S8 family serine peptidase [Ignavibacteriaceae bacterium]|nr:S8 family serine peptidase [Ignavibacteriaceae bacterium]